MSWVYATLNAIHRWATTDPTVEQRASEIARKTTVGQWGTMTPAERRQSAKFYGSNR